MSKRFKLSRRKSRRVFSKTAMHTDSHNLGSGPVRGGYRF